MTPKFDDYASSYRDLHTRSVAASGEDPEYFHRYKLACLERLGFTSGDRILDFGCGIGNLTTHLGQKFRQVHGFDPSHRSLGVCRERAPTAVLHEREEDIPPQFFDGAILSGVLHHVPPAERQALLTRVRGHLRPTGRVILFEHNPLNPLTRKAVRDCPFDDDAILLWPWKIPPLLLASGFRRPRLDFIVFFPRQLALLRPLEPRLHRLFLGAQTMTVGHV